MFIFKKHNFTYFLYGLFDTQNFGQEIKGRFFFKPTKKTGKKPALYYLYWGTVKMMPKVLGPTIEKNGKLEKLILDYIMI